MDFKQQIQINEINLFKDNVFTCKVFKILI